MIVTQKNIPTVAEALGKPEVLDYFKNIICSLEQESFKELLVKGHESILNDITEQLKKSYFILETVESKVNNRTEVVKFRRAFDGVEFSLYEKVKDTTSGEIYTIGLMYEQENNSRMDGVYFRLPIRLDSSAHFNVTWRDPSHIQKITQE